MRIAIIGGGVAGASSAIYLRNLGADVTLFEKRPFLIGGPPACHLHPGGHPSPDIQEWKSCVLGGPPPFSLANAPKGTSSALPASREAGRIQEIVQQGRDPLAAPLRVGAIYTIGPYLFPPLVATLAEMAPQMPLIIEENYTHVLAERLKRGEVDAIIISLPFEEQGVLTLPLYEEPFVALVPSSHPLNEQERVAINELAKENVLLLGSGHCFRDQVLEVCPECLRKRSTGESGPLADFEGSSLETIRYMVASGMGVTILPCTAAGADRFSQRLVNIKRFEGSQPSRTVALAWRKSFPRPQAIDTLSESFRRINLGCVKL